MSSLEDEKERIIITLDDIKYLSVMVEDVIAFEQELELMGNEHHPTLTVPTSAQGGALKQAEAGGCNGVGSQVDTELTRMNDDNKKLSANDKRNEVARAWLKTRDCNLEHAMTNKMILAKLEEFNKTFLPEIGDAYPRGLFITGNDWLTRDHSVIPKRAPGRKPSK